MVWTNPKALWGLIEESVKAWNDDYAPSMGAALAYYTLFSVAPLLIIVIAVADLVFGQDAARGAIFAQLQGLIGDEGATAIEGLVKSANKPATSTIATIVGVVTLILGATTVFGELQSDLDRIWKAAAAPKANGLWKLVRTRVLSFGLVLGMGFVLVVSLVLSATLAALGNLYGGWFDNFEWLLHIVNFIVSFAVTTGLFAMIYKLLPRVPISWHDVWIGSAVTAMLFAVGKLAIGLYLGKSGVVSGFGAAGSLVVLLIWVYYSAQIFLMGAEFTWAYARRYGSRRADKATRTAATDDSGAPAATGVSAGARARGSAAEAPALRAQAVVSLDELPLPSNERTVNVLPPEAGTNDATRAARRVDLHPALSLAITVVGFALARSIAQLITKRRSLARRRAVGGSDRHDLFRRHRPVVRALGRVETAGAPLPRLSLGHVFGRGLAPASSSLRPISIRPGASRAPAVKRPPHFAQPYGPSVITTDGSAPCRSRRSGPRNLATTSSSPPMSSRKSWCNLGGRPSGERVTVDHHGAGVRRARTTTAHVRPSDTHSAPHWILLRQSAWKRRRRCEQRSAVGLRGAADAAR